jgi:hypothetical protein
MLPSLQRTMSHHIDISLSSLSHFFRQTLTIRVFVLGGHSDCPSNMTRFLGAWFGAFPFALSQVNGRLRAKDTRQFIGVSSSMKMIPIPPFIKTFQECSVDDDSITLTRSELIDTLNSSTKDLEASLTLEAGKESSVLGGVCFNETDFTGSLKRYFREILADVVHEKNMVDRVQTLWLEENLGVTSRHRRMRTYEIETDGVVDESIGGPKHGIEYDSYLSPRDYALAQRSLIGNASQVFLSTQSLSVLMDHMENLGHTSAPYVEGLTVELLPFQSQTVQWASEREETPGGIQAFLSTKLPPTSTVPDVDLYYNFVTGKISRDKPHLARGGIIAEQMGLGKTVISLALILRNPAPVLPESGILTSCIKAPSNASSETAFWDPDLYSRTSANKKKRGSIISRGTLVVVSESLMKTIAILLDGTRGGRCRVYSSALFASILDNHNTHSICIVVAFYSLCTVQRLSRRSMDRRSKVQIGRSRTCVLLPRSRTKAGPAHARTEFNRRYNVRDAVF